MARKQAAKTATEPDTKVSINDLETRVQKGQSLPSGYAYSPSRRPPVYLVEGESGPGPDPEQGDGESQTPENTTE